MVKCSGHLVKLCNTNLLKFSKVVVEKTMVFGNLNNSKPYALSCASLIYHNEHVGICNIPDFCKVQKSQKFETF